MGIVQAPPTQIPEPVLPIPERLGSEGPESGIGASVASGGGAAASTTQTVDTGLGDD